MKKLFVLPALALFFASALSGRADQFSQIENSPYTYWVPAPPGYVAGPPSYYGPPTPVYYGPPPPAPLVVIIPRFFIGFHFH